MVGGGECVHEIGEGTWQHFEEGVPNRIPRIMSSILNEVDTWVNYFSLPQRVVCSRI